MPQTPSFALDFSWKIFAVLQRYVVTRDVFYFGFISDIFRRAVV